MPHILSPHYRIDVLFPGSYSGGASPETFFLLAENGNRLLFEDGSPVSWAALTDGLPAVTDPDGTEWVVLVQDGETRRARLADIAHG